MNDLLPKGRPPERQTRRPGLGVAVVRGLFVFARIYREYSRSGYIPLNRLSGKDRRDLRGAARYCWRLASWKFYRDRDGRRGRVVGSVVDSDGAEVHTEPHRDQETD